LWGANIITASKYKSVFCDFKQENRCSKFLTRSDKLFWTEIVKRETKIRQMDTLIYLLTIGLLATTVITFKVIDALAKELATLKKKLEK